MPLPASASSLTRRRDAGALGSWKEGGRGERWCVGELGMGVCRGRKKKEGERLPSGSHHVLVGVWEKNEGGGCGRRES